MAAHPDNEILGVGGTTATHVDREDEVTIALMCEGVHKRYGHERHEEVVRQANQATSILGITDLVLQHLPDQPLDTLPLGEVIGEVEAFLSHTADVAEYPHPRSHEALRARAQFWGNRVNRSMVEAFTVARSLRRSQQNRADRIHEEIPRCDDR